MKAFCLYLAMLQALVFAQEDPIVVTKYGSVSGKSIALAGGTVIDSYLGIPFARPPIGDLRFMVAQEPDPWDEPYLAHEIGHACMQPVISSAQLTHLLYLDFDEDCLNLNIYTPQRENPDELLPVMVWIHGGGFDAGANFIYPGYFLAEKDVVYVSVNYRLGIMGFAYSGDGVVTGNMGIEDQILALRFVQENIEAFGGDPGRVTIFGESAGGASVGILLMSPLAEGLFHNAILQSGSDLGVWTVAHPAEDPEIYLTHVAEQFNCTTDDTEEMVSCLQEVNPRRLIDANVNCTGLYPCSGFGPVVDGRLLPDRPENLRAAGQYNKVPEMIGTTEDESAIFIIGYPGLNSYGLNRTDFDAIIWESISDVSPSWPDPSRDEDVFQAIRFYYADWPYFEDPEKNRAMWVKMETDNGFGFSSDMQAKLHSEDDLSVYYYVHDYIPETFNFPDWTGAFHGTEILFEMGWPFMYMEENEMALNHSQSTTAGILVFSEYDAEISDFMMTLWTNFAKFSNPTPEPVNGPNGTIISWPSYVNGDFNYLSMKATPVVKKDYRQKDYAFWREYIPYLIYGENFEANQHSQQLPALMFTKLRQYFTETDIFGDDHMLLEESEYF